MPKEENIVLIIVVLCSSLAVFLFAWAFIRYVRLKWAKNKEGFYVSQKIRSEAEKKFEHFLLHLIRIYPDTFRQYLLMNQVSVPRVVSIAEGKFTWEEFNKIGNKDFDFVLMDKESSIAKLVIELDDRTHLLTHRIKRDKFIDKVLANAKIPILHVKVQRHYDEQEVYAAILAKLNSVF